MNNKNDTGTLAAECDRAAIDPGDVYVVLRDDAGEFGSHFLGSFGDEDKAVAACQEDADLHAMMPEGDHEVMVTRPWQAVPDSGAAVRHLVSASAPSSTMYRILCSGLNQSLAG
jgi:hypothetical protein